MKIKTMSPDEAKKKAKAKVAEWKRQKEKAAVKGNEKDEKERLYVELLGAVVKDDAEQVELLIRQGADPREEHCNIVGMTPLMIASEMGHVGIVKLLLAHGAKVNSRTEGAGATNTGVDWHEGKTALIFAARLGHVEVARLLLEHGADPNIIDSIYDTALKLANAKPTTAREREMVKLLKEHGAKE
jgi:ankyrin repeat protein